MNFHETHESKRKISLFYQFYNFYPGDTGHYFICGVHPRLKKGILPFFKKLFIVLAVDITGGYFRDALYMK